MRRILHLSFGKRGLRRDVDAEIQLHLEMRTQDLIAAGWDPGEAREAARAAFGDVNAVRDEVLRIRAGTVRRRRWAKWADTLRQDVGYAARAPRRSPGFAAAVIVTFALGIGANTAIFSVIHGVLLRPLPYAGAGPLVSVQQRVTGESGVREVGLSPVELADIRAAATTLEGLAEYHSMAFILVDPDEPRRVQTGIVSPVFFGLLGVEALYGRTFRASDDRAEGEAALVLSHGFWLQEFGADPRVVGRAFEMNGRVHRVIGVLPPVPGYPEHNDVYMPTSACPFRSGTHWSTHREARGLAVIARAKAGLTPAEVEGELKAVAARMRAAQPDAYPAAREFSLAARSVRDEVTRPPRPRLLLLLGAAGFLLLTVCANVANLTLARVIQREREWAVRAALGAGRARLVRQRLTESMLLAVVGGALGLALAAWTLDLLVAYVAKLTPRAAEVRMDAVVLGFTLGVSLLTGLVVGWAPGFPAPERAARLAAAARMPGTSRSRARLTLVISQVAVSFTLLIGAGLLLRSFLRLQGVDPGFEPERVWSARIDLSWAKYDDGRSRRFAEALLARLRAEDDVRAAAVANVVPLGAEAPNSFAFRIEGREIPTLASWPEGDHLAVSPGYFAAMEVPLLRGRPFTQADHDAQALVVLISAAMAERYWPGEDPVGQRVWPDNGEDAWHEVIGVVGDVRQTALDREPAPVMYGNFAHDVQRDLRILVRSALEPREIEALVRDLVRTLDAEQPVTEAQTLSAIRRESLASSRLTLLLVGLFAALAFAITAAGIGGTVGYTVSRRTSEIGVRMALGAAPSRVRRMVLRQALGPVVVGLAIGAAGSLLLARALSGMLYDLESTDPVTFAGVTLLIVLVSMCVAWVPARRATRIDPATALRCD